MSMFATSHVPAVVNAEETAPSKELAHPQRGARERELLQVCDIVSLRNFKLWCYMVLTNQFGLSVGC